MTLLLSRLFFFFFQAEDGIRDTSVTGVQTCALPISQIARIEASVNPQVMEIAAKPKPTTGLEGKLSVYHAIAEIGRASCRERVEISVGAGRINKKKGRRVENQNE